MVVNKQKILNYAGVEALFHLNIDAIKYSQSIITDDVFIFITWFDKNKLVTYPVPPEDKKIRKQLKELL